jgi:hypothetical protein
MKKNIMVVVLLITNCFMLRSAFAADTNDISTGVVIGRTHTNTWFMGGGGLMYRFADNLAA